jgi:putative transposase
LTAHTLLRRPVESGQFVSLAFGQKARDAGIAVSMGSTGCAYDNAVAESFFATLKKELVHRRSWPSRRELISEVFEFVEGFYNTTRRHSTPGYLSPAQFEAMIMIKINKEKRLRRKPESVRSTGSTPQCDRSWSG